MVFKISLMDTLFVPFAFAMQASWKVGTSQGKVLQATAVLGRVLRFCRSPEEVSWRYRSKIGGVT
jgi:hypothetical protein